MQCLHLCAGARACCCTRHPPLLMHSRAEVLFTTQWNVQLFLPCHCLVSWKTRLSTRGLRRGGIVPCTFEPWAAVHRVQGGSPGCWDPLHWCRVLEGFGWWQGAAAAPSFALIMFQKLRCLASALLPTALPGELVPRQCFPFPRRAACSPAALLPAALLLSNSVPCLCTSRIWLSLCIIPWVQYKKIKMSNSSFPSPGWSKNFDEWTDYLHEKEYE